MMATASAAEVILLRMLFGVGLFFGGCGDKGGMGVGETGNARDAGEMIERYLEAAGREELRRQIDVGEAGLITEAPIGIADQPLDGFKTLRDPLADPGGDLRVRPTGAPQFTERTDIVERMDIATDDRGDAPHLGALNRISRHKRRLWNSLFKIFEDGGGLRHDRAVSELHRWDAGLRIDRPVGREKMFAAVAHQMHGNAVIADALEREADAHPMRGS